MASRAMNDVRALPKLPESSAARQTTRVWIAAPYLAFLMVFGGGGSPAPLSELLCQLAAAAALAAWIAFTPKQDRPVSRLAVVVILLLALPPILQLVPLPPALWQALPGRAVAAEALDLAGAGGGWHLLSLAPHRTLAALLSLGPPLVALWFATRIERREWRVMIRTIAAVVLLEVAVGAAQLAQSVGTALDFYGNGSHGSLLGFHANRNSTADAMLVGIVASCLVWAELRRPDRLWTRATLLVLVATLLLGLFLTGSRTGIGLAPIALGFCYALARHGTAPGSAWLWVRNWRIWLVGSTVLAAGAAAAALLADRAPVARVLARFDFSKEFRPEIWRDSWHAALQYWPWGSGLGTFDPAFLPSERLEVVDNLLPNRAHNEMLELAVEGGLPLLAAWLVAAGVVLISLKRQLGPGGLLPRRHALFAAAVLTIIGFHSLVDYPLRSMAMASLVALAAGMVLSSVDRKASFVAKMTDSSQ